MSEKENYFKSYFKAYGVFATIIMIIAFLCVGYVAVVNKKIINSEQIRNLVYGATIALVVGFAVLGLCKLKSEKISFIDFIRVVGLFGSIVMIVMSAIGKVSWKAYAVFIGCAAVFLVEIVVRFIKANDPEPASFKNYYGALAGAYNPILILLVGIALAVVATILAAGSLKLPVLSELAKYKYFVLGGIVALLVILMISGLDNNIDVSLLDLLLAVTFVASTYFIYLGASVGIAASTLKVDLLIAAASAVGLIVRGFTYNKGKYYGDNSHKVRYYFLQVYDKFNAAFAVAIGFVVLTALALPVVGQISGNSVNKVLGFTPSVMVGSIIVLVVAVILLVLALLFRKFKSTKIEKIDYLLIIMLYSSAFVVPFLITIAVSGNFSVLTDNIMALVATIVIALVFVFAAVVQFIRLRNYDALSEVVKQYEYKKEVEEEKAEEEAKEEAEEKAEEEAKEEAEEEKDPFAISEEEEELLKTYYGEEETAEEPQEEPEEVVEEEVVEEEQPEEETAEEEVVEEEQPVEEQAEEEVAEEEQPVEEEVVEEQPVEEQTEEVADEDSEEDADEEADDEDADDDADEYADEEDGEELEDIHKKTKEAGIIVQDFQVVDENGNVKKIKRRFNSRMMFAPYETKEYYNEIKNYLVMYRAKGRNSSRCESFRYKGLVSKVALGGKSIKVFLALPVEFIDANPKYHLKDVSSKKQYAEVPVMIKVRSPRALKYFKELVDIMMANRGVKPKRNFQPTNYMPELIPNGEAIMATLGMRADYLQDNINVHSIPEDMPDDLDEYLPMINGEPLDDEEIEASVYLDTLCNHFEDGDEITIDLLKSLHIVTSGNVLRIKARGTLDRKLTIYAEYFDADALKMLMCANCRCIKIIRDQDIVEE